MRSCPGCSWVRRNLGEEFCSGQGHAPCRRIFHLDFGRFAAPLRGARTAKRQLRRGGGKWMQAKVLSALQSTRIMPNRTCLSVSAFWGRQVCSTSKAKAQSRSRKSSLCPPGKQARSLPRSFRQCSSRSLLWFAWLNCATLLGHVVGS